MAYLIKDEKTDALLRQLAKVRRSTMADALRDVIAEALAREERKMSVAERLEPLRAKLRAMGPHEPVDWEELKRQSDEDWGEPG